MIKITKKRKKLKAKQKKALKTYTYEGDNNE